MTKAELDEWCSTKMIKIAKKMASKYDKIIDLESHYSEFYMHIIPRLNKITEIDNYFKSFLYNRSYRYHGESEDIILNYKNCKIYLVSDFPVEPKSQSEEDIEDEDKLNTLISHLYQLPIDDKRLYELYYVKGKTLREIANIIGVSHVMIFKQLQKMKTKLKKYLNK